VKKFYMRLWYNLPHHLNCVITLLRKFKLQHFSVKNAIILCSFMFTAKENRKSHCQLSNLQCCHFEIVILRVAIISNAQNVRLQCRHRPTDNASTRRWRGSQRPLPGACSMDPVVRNRFRKCSTPHLLHFLFGNSLISRVIPYFFDSQTFLWISCFLLLAF